MNRVENLTTPEGFQCKDPKYYHMMAFMFWTYDMLSCILSDCMATDMNIEWSTNRNRGMPVPASRMKSYTDLCCRVYSQRAMAPLTWTLSDLTTPNWGISMQASRIWIISTGIPSFSRPRTRTCRQIEIKWHWFKRLGILLHSSHVQCLH